MFQPFNNPILGKSVVFYLKGSLGALLVPEYIVPGKEILRQPLPYKHIGHARMISPFVGNSNSFGHTGPS
jgi:hypothetical protein